MTSLGAAPAQGGRRRNADQLSTRVKQSRAVVPHTSDVVDRGTGLPRESEQICFRPPIYAKTGNKFMQINVRAMLRAVSGLSFVIILVM